ncbi:RING-type E3 ubiquitin transferase [Trifolium repens]|nr:RING-type E3 ubiquitin transferase [Trifolium repens]
MGEQSSGRISMEIDMNQEPYPDQLSVAIANIGALNLNDSIPQPFNRFGSNLYNPDTWEHVLIYPRNRGEKPEAALKKSNDGSVYDCNICLDLAKEPVVTCCGHLFCWPCLYRWLNLRSSRTRTKECPVCKGEVTDQDVIPIYGVGNDDEVRNEGSSSATPQIPRRPNAKRVSRDPNVMQMRDPNVMQMRDRILDRGASFSALFNLSER